MQKSLEECYRDGCENERKGEENAMVAGKNSWSFPAKSLLPGCARERERRQVLQCILMFEKSRSGNSLSGFLSRESFGFWWIWENSKFSLSALLIAWRYFFTFSLPSENVLQNIIIINSSLKSPVPEHPEIFYPFETQMYYCGNDLIYACIMNTVFIASP